MQAYILSFKWLEILGPVGNFEIKTFSQGGELWIEILSQGLGSLTPNFCFWSKYPPYPVIPPPPGHNIDSGITQSYFRHYQFTECESNSFVIM